MDGIRNKKSSTKNHLARIEKSKKPKKGNHLKIVEDTKKTEKERRKFKIKKLFFLSLFLFFSACILYALFISWKFYSLGRSINIESDNQKSFTQELASTTKTFFTGERTVLSGEDTNRINILLLGTAGEDNPGRNLTDTIMIASINTENRKVSLLSLPRDLYVEVPQISLQKETKDNESISMPSSGISMKINSVYKYGLINELGAEPILKTIHNITGLPIQYYLIMDYEGFEKAVDALNGIYVDVPMDIYDTKYPGPNYSYETFELKKGYQKLNGETALKYVRERHSDPDGDFGRARRQQQVMQSIKNRALSMKTLLNPLRIQELFQVVEDNIRTNMTLEEIESLIVLSQNLDTQNITTRVVDAWKKESLLKVSHIYYENSRAFILVPKTGNYSQIQELAENIFEIDKIEKRKEEISKESAKVAIVNRSGNSKLANKILKLLKESLGIKNTSIVHPEDQYEIDKTYLQDNSEKEKIYTLDELASKLPAPIARGSSENMPKYDIVLILGKDFIQKHDFEEANIEEFKNSSLDQEYFEIQN